MLYVGVKSIKITVNVKYLKRASLFIFCPNCGHIIWDQNEKLLRRIKTKRVDASYT